MERLVHRDSRDFAKSGAQGSRWASLREARKEPCAPIFSKCFWANFSTMSRNGHPCDDSVAWRAHSTRWPDSVAWHTYTTGGGVARLR